MWICKKEKSFHAYDTSLKSQQFKLLSDRQTNMLQTWSSYIWVSTNWENMNTTNKENVKESNGQLPWERKGNVPLWSVVWAVVEISDHEIVLWAAWKYIWLHNTIAFKQPFIQQSKSCLPGLKESVLSSKHCQSWQGFLKSSLMKAALIKEEMQRNDDDTKWTQDVIESCRCPFEKASKDIVTAASLQTQNVYCTEMYPSVTRKENWLDVPAAIHNFITPGPLSVICELSHWAKGFNTEFHCQSGQNFLKFYVRRAALIREEMQRNYVDTHWIKDELKAEENINLQYQAKQQRLQQSPMASPQTQNNIHCIELHVSICSEKRLFAGCCGMMAKSRDDILCCGISNH